MWFFCNYMKIFTSNFAYADIYGYIPHIYAIHDWILDVISTNESIVNLQFQIQRTWTRQTANENSKSMRNTNRLLMISWSIYSIQGSLEDSDMGETVYGIRVTRSYFHFYTFSNRPQHSHVGINQKKVQINRKRRSRWTHFEALCASRSCLQWFK